MMVTRARRQGASAPCPRLGNRSAKSSSSYSFPNSSRMRIHTLPLGMTACAMRTVSSGIAGIGWGCRDMDSLLVSVTLSFAHQYLLSLPDPALIIRQQYRDMVDKSFTLLPTHFKPVF